MVRWLDAHTDTQRQIWSLEELQDHNPLVVETVGWVLVESPKGITLGQERITGEDGSFSYRNVGFIPKGMIVGVFPLVPRSQRPKSLYPNPSKGPKRSRKGGKQADPPPPTEPHQGGGVGPLPKEPPAP